MKKITKIFSVSALTALALAFTSCESREQASYGEGCTPLANATISVADAQYNSLTFKWAPVAGAVEYGYKLTDKNDEIVYGGLTKVDSIKFEDLDYSTEYTFHLTSYAAVTSENTTSEEITLATSTPFYSTVNTSGTYSSCLVSGQTSWSSNIVEERIAGKDSEYGTFTISSWYTHEGYDLQFTVNNDSTINVLNGTRDAVSTRLVTVAAGQANITTNLYVRYGVIIDESLARFDRENHTLTLYVKSTRKTGTNKEGYDTFSWE